MNNQQTIETDINLPLKNNQNYEKGKKTTTHVFQKLFPSIQDFNLGIILCGTYYLLELGSIQGLFPIVDTLRLPLLLALFSLGYAIYLLIKGQIDFTNSTSRVFAFLCLYIVIYSAISTHDPEVRMNLVKGFIMIFVNYIIIISSVKRLSQFILLIDFLLVAMLHSSFHGIMQGGLIYGSRWLKDQNHISLLATICLPYAFVLFLEYKHIIKKICYLLCIFAFTTVNVVAASRGGGLSLIVVVALFLLILKNKIRNLIIILIGIFLVIKFAPPIFLSEMQTLEQGTDNSVADRRIFLWDLGIQVFMDNPIFGVGPMNNADYLKLYGDTWDTVREMYQVVHSTPIQWLVEKGIIGLIILFLLQLRMYRNWRTNSLSLRFDFENKNKLKKFISMNHACAISQVAFWTGSIFLSLLTYPFYWFLIPLSEAWKIQFENFIKENEKNS